MTRPGFVALSAALLFSAVAQAQDAKPEESPADQPVVDAVSRQATAMEAELGKYKDNAPEAAEVMVKLADLYHQHARVFGLIRVSNRFVAAHPTDPRHKDVMLKLMDGLEIASRNKELTVACRQFLARYPKVGEVPAVEIRLARTLEQMDDRVAAADALRAVWNRQPGGEVGTEHALKAIELYSSVNNARIFSQAAELCDEMVDRLPKGETAAQAGLRGVYEWRRAGEYAKSNLLANKLLKKGMPADPERKRQVYNYLAENYGNLSQHANAVDALASVRKIKDSPYHHLQMINRMHHAAFTPQQMEATVNEYVKNYPDRDDRHVARSLLAHAYLRAEDKPRAVAVFAELLPFDARTNSNASLYVSHNGNEPEQLAKSEKVLRDAISKNEKDAAYLRYILGFTVYRDRLKDVPKARRTLQELIQHSPTNDNHTSNAISWLLSSAEDDNQFRRDVALILEARKQHPELTNFGGYLSNWLRSVRRNKELQDRAAFLTAQLQQSDGDPLISVWKQIGSNRDQNGAQVRAKLLEPGSFNKLNDAAAMFLLQTQATHFWSYAGSNNRPKAAGIYAQMCRRFPEDFQAAVWYLQTATDYAPEEVAREAALNLMKFDPPWVNNDIWRRLMTAADKNKDPELAKQALAWIQKTEEKFGRQPGYGYLVGDVLTRLELNEEANAYWKSYIDVDRNNWDSSYCADRLVRQLEGDEKAAFVAELFQHDSDFHGQYALWLAGHYFQAGDLDNFEKVLREARKRQDGRAFRPWHADPGAAINWVMAIRNNQEATEADKLRVYSVVRDLRLARASAAAVLALTELDGKNEAPNVAELLELQATTRMVGNEYYDFDQLMPFVQTALAEKQYMRAVTLLTGMLANISNSRDDRQKRGRDLVAQCYSRMGSVGLTIDENSPIAPLLQAALYLRLGDDELAFDTYMQNRALFTEHRTEAPVDLLLFVCERHIAAGGDENHEFVEDVVRGWQIKHNDSEHIDVGTKARIQLLLAKNFFKSQRYDLARSEFTTVVNRFPGTPEAIEGEFGIGETFMAQKVYDQAEAVFEKLAGSREAEIVVRAEFLRGVLAYRRGDRDEARDIFRSVLERVPNIELANQALYNLAEVYGSEERYIDQLNLLRTVGRLGRTSKRLHKPGTSLSIVVQDSDLGISRGHNRIPVVVTTEPGGDEETIYLLSGGAGKGLFRADVETRLGQVTKNDSVLQLTGRDSIKCDYPDQFKAEFKNVPLSDVDIRIAADAEFEIASSKIVDEEEETFSQRLEREAEQEENADQRVSQVRPANQIKPGNVVYMRVEDADRDLSDEPDQIIVKLTADSGDEVQVALTETGPHTGLFEGTAPTAELPAGALASDTSIEHNPLMAIDKDPNTYWLSEPDGASPKSLTVDMKDLKSVARVRVSTPNAEEHASVRGTLLGSYDGVFWYRLAGNPMPKKAPPVADEFGPMQQRVFAGNYTRYDEWNDVVSLSRNSKPIDESLVNELAWQLEEGVENADQAHAVVWHGKLVQERAGAARFAVQGVVTALALDGILELPVGSGNRTVDVWLDQGTHELTIFAATNAASRGLSATWARANQTGERVTLVPFTKADFDLDQPAADIQPAAANAAAQATPIILGLDTVQLNKTSEQFGPHTQYKQEQIGHWQSNDDWVSWEFDVPQPGAYDVVLEYSHQSGGTRFGIEFGTELGNRLLTGTTPDTGDWDDFRQDRVGTVLVEQSGKYKLAVKPVELQEGQSLMDLRSVVLKLADGPRVVMAEKAWEFRFPPSELRYVRFLVHEYLGEAVAINNIEVAGARPNQLYIPTETDVLSLANNNVLEIAGGDVVTATYTDEATQSEAGQSRLLTAELTATYFNAEVTSIAYDFERRTNGQVDNIRKQVMRIDPGERIVVEIVDYDQDQSADRDTVRLEVAVNDGEPIELTATETEEYTGIFTKEVDTSAAKEEGKLQIKPGDRVYCRYFDEQNTFPGHSVPRETTVYVNEPTDGNIRILETRVIPPPEDSQRRQPQITYHLPAEDQEVGGVAFEAPLTVEVIDPDAAKDDRSSINVTLVTTDGSQVDVECVVSNAFAPPRQAALGNWALREGRFVGQVILQLGGKNSPQLVPLSADMPRNLIGGPTSEEDESQSALDRTLVTRVLNLTGQDVITGAYRDKLRPDKKPLDLSSKARLITNGTLAVTDRDYKDPIEQLHVGEKLFLRVVDADGDTSDERDRAVVEITSEFGEQETVELFETLAHSGVFTGSLPLKPQDKPTPGNLNAEEPFVESYFGDALTVRYVDRAASTETGELEVAKRIPVVIGTDGLVSAFSKTFNDEELAVETKFTIAESYFELFKSHNTLERQLEATGDLEAGRRVLQEVMEDYPDPKYVPRISYLLGQFAQELKQWSEAVESYELIVRQHPDHPLAPDAQYKLAQCYEEAENFDQALEEYVTLAATYPKSPLIANVMIRISDHFYKGENFEVAAQVGAKFLERFETHQYASRIAFRVGQCYYKSEQYPRAGEAFDLFVKQFPDDALAADALFWSGESFRMGRNNQFAFRRYNECRWKFPASEAARYARGRLALPEMLAQFEAEANSIDNDN